MKPTIDDNQQVLPAENITQHPNGGNIIQVPQQSQSTIQAATQTDDPGRTMGIVGLVLAFILPIAGIIVSFRAKNKSKKSGFINKTAQTGFITSIILTIIELAVAVFFVSIVSNIYSGKFIIGNWSQTASGLTFNESVSGAGVDYIEMGSDKSIKWYSDSSDKTKNYSIGTYTVEYGNKTNDKGQYTSGDFILYTLTFSVDKFVDENSKENIVSKDLDYLIYFNPKEQNVFNAINSNTLRGYKFAKE